jgi:hypothetical protein
MSLNNGTQLSCMGSTIVVCRGGGLYVGRWVAPGGGGKVETQQALDKPNSVGGDYVASVHAFFKGLMVQNSSFVKLFDHGQVPEDMTRFTEAGLRMIATVLVDEKNTVRSEPVDSLLTEYFLTEAQLTDAPLFKTLVSLIPRNMVMATRNVAVDVSTIDANKTGERTTTKRFPVPGHGPHIVVFMTNIRAQDSVVKERFETAAIVMQRCFCGGPIDTSSGAYSCLTDLRQSGFGQYTWNSEKAMGIFPTDTANMSALFCTAYAASAYYAMLCNKHGMYLMHPSSLCTGLNR